MIIGKNEESAIKFAAHLPLDTISSMKGVSQFVKVVAPMLKDCIGMLRQNKGVHVSKFARVCVSGNRLFVVVLDINTQILDDFQCLCNHCNLLKRQICKDEKKNNKLYSAKDIPKYGMHDTYFPWEMKPFDSNDPTCKNDTYWHDPVEFNRKLYIYLKFTLPIANEIKRKVSNKTLTKVA